MIKKILYGVIGFAAGALFPVSALMVDHLFVHQQNSPITTLLHNPVHFFILLYPALFAVAVVAFMNIRERLSLASEELEYFESQLNASGQQDEIDKLVQELSANLEHLVEITNNIHEGICVIDRNLNIEYGYNQPFIGMFGKMEYNGKSVFDTIFRHVAGSIKKELKEYLDLCFTNTATSDDMINGVNPVGRFTYPNSEAGAMQETILKSKIVRMKNQAGTIKNVMFIFNDITLDENVDVAFKKSEKAFDDEMSIMSSIYRNDKDLVINFINEMNDVLEKIQERYMEIEQDRENARLLDEIQGIVHLIKGEAFSLGFEGIAHAAKNMEDFIKTIGDADVTMEINLQIIEHYEEIYSMVNTVNSVAQKLFSIGEGTGKISKDSITINIGQFDELKKSLRDILGKYRKSSLKIMELLHLQKKVEHLDFMDMAVLRKELNLISEKSALQYNKRILLNFIYDIDGLPKREYRSLKEVLVHLIRNSAAHGIEDVAKRRERDKYDEGRINIHIFSENSEYSVLYSDDGGGFDLKKIASTAIAQKLISPERAARLTEKETLTLVFKNGFSTKEDPDMVSGAGIGMSAVGHTVLNSLHGTLKISNKPGIGVSLKMSFPQSLQQ